MSEWKVYSTKGVEKAQVKELELHDEWMAECYLTVTVKSANPVSFQIGDYIDYRGERYSINYDPTVLKKARKGTYGEGFVYDSIKFVSDSQSKIVGCDFTDIVLDDNQMHYTGLPTFPFYCESVDDLLDRVQACLEELYPGRFILIGLNTARNAQRGLAVGRESDFVNAYKRYVDPTGAEKTDSYGKTSVALSVDNITCWEAITKINSDFGLNFIMRGDVVIAGINGVFTPDTFRYGKGNGLYEIERISEQDQQVITRLKAYGSEENLPTRYYAELNLQVFAHVERIEANYETSGLHYAAFWLDLDFNAKYFTERSKSYPVTSDRTNYIVRITANGITVKGYVRMAYDSQRCYIYSEYTGVNPEDDRDETDQAAMNAFSEAIKQGDTVYFVGGIEKGAFPLSNRNYSTENLPNNMSVSRLMLPGFPNKSLYDWVKEHGGTDCDDERGIATINGFTGYFSKDKHRPWLQSLKAEDYDIRPGNIYFDGSNDTENIHPTLEGMKYGGHDVDVIAAAEQITDNGVYGEGNVPNFTITLPILGFDLAEVYEEGATIDMKDGMCGSRSFKMANRPIKNSNGQWECKVERVKDDSLDLWFPYKDFQIKAGDHYVLTGIKLPNEYVSAASEKLFDAAIEALQKNDTTRFTYQPRIDEIWMARQHDAAIKDGETSLHDTLHAGDIFLFKDDDLGIDEGIIIDVLTIRERGNDGIPTYEVTLRNEKQVSSIQRMIDKAVGSNASGAGGGGYTSRQIQSLIENYGGERFLSKLNDDTAQGLIRFLRGLQVGSVDRYGIDADGNINGNDADLLGDLNVGGDADVDGILRALAKVLTNHIESSNWTGDGPFDTGFQLLKSKDGVTSMVVDNLFVRMKAIFTELEIRKVSYAGGNIIFSHAGSKVVRVEPVYRGISAEVEGHKAILDGAVDVSGNTAYLGGGTVTGHKLTITNSQTLYAYRCYLLADDGSTRTENWWRVDDQARCQTFNIKEGVYQNVSNQFYWRRVIATGSETLEDGKVYDYVDLSAADCMQGSTVPQAGDQLAQMGNRTDTDRQGFISIEVSGDLAPAFKVYRGVNSYTLDGKRKICISPKLTEIRANKFVEETSYGVFVQPRQRDEEWYYGMQCYYYDLVQYDGATWLCIYPESGIGGVMYTTDMPSEDSPYWRIYARKGKDGSDGKSFNILGSYDSEAELIAAHPTGEIGDAYIVAGYLYVWDAVNNRWHNSGQIKGDPGRGIRSAKISYGIGTATDLPSEWKDSVSELSIQPGNYLYVRTILYYTDGTPSDPSYSISRFGLDGAYKATAFCRTNKDISAQQLSGGTMSNAVPNPFQYQGETITFTDGIPAGEAVVWAASNVFYGDGTQAGWTYARRMSDTATFDVEFSPNETKPADPSNDVSQREAQGWYDLTRNPSYDFTNSIWRAERHCKNGVWSAWAIEKIKGEKGDSVAYDEEHSSVGYAYSSMGTPEAGRDYPSDISSWSPTPPAVQNGKYLWTKDVTAYDNAGTIVYTTTYGVQYQPNDGESVEIDSSRTHVRYSTQKTAQRPADSTFTLVDPPALQKGDYLWILSQTAYVGSQDVLKSYSVSYVGTDGTNGDPGVDGFTTHFAYATSADGSQNFSTTNFQGATHIGTYRDQKAADSQDYHDYIWTEWKGEAGENGTSAATCFLDKSVVFVKVDTDGYVIDDFEEFVHFSVYQGTGVIAAKSAQVNENGHQQYVEVTGGKVTDMTGTTITVNNHTAIIHSGASVSGHKVTLTGNYVTSPNALRIRVQRGTLIDEHVATMQVIAEDADGNEYLCIAPMSIQREVIAKDGRPGEDGQPGAPGDDAVNVMLTPENVILEQNEDDESVIDLTKAYSVVSVNKGGAPDNNFTLSIVGREHCQATVDNNTKRVTITQIDTHKEDPTGPSSENIFYDNGYVDVRISYGGQNYDKRFGFYANLLGTWKRTVVGDAEAVAADKVAYIYDPKNPNQVVKMETFGNYVRSSTENSAKLERDTTEVVENIANTAFEDIEGTQVALSAGEYIVQLKVDTEILPNGNYVFDFVDFHYEGSEPFIEQRITVANSGRYTVTLHDDVQSGEGEVFLLYIGRVFNVSSEIKQTADSISSEVKGLKNGKNLLSGVLTGSGWKSCASLPTSSSTPTYHDITVDANGNLIRATGDTYLVSPTFQLKLGKEYTLSFTGGGSFMVYVKNVSSGNVTDISSNHMQGGGRLSTNFTSSGNYNSARAFFGANISKPQIETGSEATAFEAGDTEVSSQTKQMADNIQLFVTNGLNNTGIDITNGNIDLIASKVTFSYYDNGTKKSDKISINAATGTLKAVDVDLTGKITATSGAIGGFAINTSQIKSSNNNIILNSNGSATIGGFEIAEGGTARLKSTLTVGNATSQRIEIIPFLNGTYGSQAIEFIKSGTGNNKEVVMELGFDNNNYGHIGINKPATNQDTVDSFISIDADSLQINTQDMGDFNPITANMLLLTNTTSSFSMFSFNEPTEGQKLFECGIRNKAITLRAYKSNGDSAWPEYSYVLDPDRLSKGSVQVMSLDLLRFLFLNPSGLSDRLSKLSVLLIRNNATY